MIDWLMFQAAFLNKMNKIRKICVVFSKVSEGVTVMGNPGRRMPVF